jgi:hypothetical protein
MDCGAVPDNRSARLPPKGVASSDTFSPKEYGSGSRPTPLVDPPAWLKAQAKREPSPNGDRATLTPGDRAFLDSIPSYGEDPDVLEVLAPPPLPTPSSLRRVLSLLLFVTIAGGACTVLGLAVLRMLGKTLFQ